MTRAYDKENSGIQACDFPNAGQALKLLNPGTELQRLMERKGIY